MYNVYFLLEGGGRMLVATDQTKEQADKMIARQLEPKRYIIEKAEQ